MLLDLSWERVEGISRPCFEREERVELCRVDDSRVDRLVETRERNVIHMQSLLPTGAKRLCRDNDVLAPTALDA